MASTSGTNSNLEAENRLLKKQLEVADQMYNKLFEEFKKLKTKCLLLEEDVELLKRNQNQNEAPNQAIIERYEALVEMKVSSPENENEAQALAPARLEPVSIPIKLKSEDDYYSSCFGEGKIQFGRCDVHGNFLELKNESNHVKKLGFYRIKRIVGDSVIEVPLPEFTRIQPTSSLVIRCGSSETPILNSNTIILENVGHWLSGELMQTFLLDPRGVEVASIVQKELDYA